MRHPIYMYVWTHTQHVHPSVAMGIRFPITFSSVVWAHYPLFLALTHLPYPFRYPDNTPRTKEAYWYRTLFEQHFPQRSAVESVPGGPSVACSTPTAAL